mgnify:CR=1 FL=1
MSRDSKIYKCPKGMVIEVLNEVSCYDLSCCGEPMVDEQANTVDAAKEKHVPIVEKTEEGLIVKVGSVAHPMTEAHYIMWIEVIGGDWVTRKYLNPGETPEVTFWTKDKSDVTVRAYCNLHGLWQVSL